MFFDCLDDSIDIESILSNYKGNSEYLVALDAKLNAVVGFSLLTTPPGLVLFLSSGQVVTLNVITNPTFLRNIRTAAAAPTFKEKDTTDSSAMLSSKIFSGSFVESIRQILASGTTQPILKLTERTPKESLELLLDAFQRLRDQYISKHDTVRQKIENRVKILRVLDEQQRQEVAELLQEKSKLRENAERLAEKYEEINDRQQALMKSLHEIFRLINLRMPAALVAERNFSEQINKIHAVTKDLANNIAACKKKMEKQQQLATTDKPSKVLTLQPKQETVLKEILADSNAQIETQINEIKRIKKNLNID